MKIDIVTLFPGMFSSVFGESMIKRAREKGAVELNVHDLRNWTYDNHRTADDKPYGGGPGMVMKIEPVDRALNALKSGDVAEDPSVVILTTPHGRRFEQATAREISRNGHIIMICGHYEGVDERIRSLVDMEISIGDYILTCGELPAMVIADTVIRLLPGVLGDERCLEDESFENGMLEYPQYTRPAEYKGMKVPDVLRGGDHKKIEKWKMEQAMERTARRRPDLLR
ncbi:MAG: tRNA (guanosine(37)-N1)-methyltransferase TrmD [Candidatus Omnitrophica bacterium]|nr:tRNA (guanosine(37)-N1)-methyltransferase TrmD [Candidatus Omnitrophota bacterium]